jgi:CysZ protein
MENGFFAGAHYLLIGLRWLPRAQIRGFVLIPLLVNTLLFGSVVWWGIKEFDAVLNGLLVYLPVWLDWLRWLLWPFFAVTILVMSFYTFTLLANLIASPFNGLLAERVEAMVKPDVLRPPQRPLWQEIALAPLVELKKFAYFLLWALPLLLLFFIPGINTLVPFIWLAFGAWLLALQYMDYPMSNHGILFRQQRQRLRQQRMLVMGFGSAVMLLTLVPVVNFLAMPAAVIGATLMWVERFHQGNPSNAQNETR